MTSEIYVSLQGEGTVVWRPVSAERLRENVFRIAEQPYDRETESWEFEPGDIVLCEIVQSSEGSILAATRKAGAGD
jgi:hypothetical protein